MKRLNILRLLLITLVLFGILVVITWAEQNMVGTNYDYLTDVNSRKTFADVLNDLVKMNPINK